MIPKASSTTERTTESKTVSFDLVPEREALEESRYNVAVERLKEEEISAEKAMIESEQHAEKLHREEKMKELVECKESVGQELKQSQKEIDAEVKKTGESIEKRMTKVVDEQAEAALSLAI